jgi:hypothetical protein
MVGVRKYVPLSCEFSVTSYTSYRNPDTSAITKPTASSLTRSSRMNHSRGLPGISLVRPAPFSNYTILTVFPGGLQPAFPKVYAHVASLTHSLYDRPSTGPKLRRPFYGSAYTMAAFNFGPRTCTRTHRDSSNSPGVPCAITALGRFNPNTGSHFVLRNLRLVICFPPGGTILVPSASFEHGNVSILPGETRTSYTQYCPGGILRFVDWGVEGWASKSKKEQDKIRAAATARFSEVIGRFSTVDELNA